MNKDEVKKLFLWARKAIKARFNNEVFEPTSIPEPLKVKHGVFVTLTINDQLKGCIGQVTPVPLWKGVITAARRSAFSDPRFLPLTKKEFKKVVIELSILSQPEDTTKAGIKKGDGVIINKNHQSALFLPQVWDKLPDKEDFLKNLFLKAGLTPGESGVSFKKFSVSAWKEKSPGNGIQLIE